MAGGRPRKIHSKPTTGVGGRELTDSEVDAIIDVVDHYLGDDELVSIDDVLHRIWKAYGSYLAWGDALGDPASAGKEVRDVDSIVLSGTRVYRDIESFADRLSNEPESIARAASEFATRLLNFPPRTYGLIVNSDPAGPFARDKKILERSIVQLRFWDLQREELLEVLERFLQACQRAPVPKVETKPTLFNRRDLACALGKVYNELIHPPRVRLWEEQPNKHNDLKPHPAPNTFAERVMKILNVKYEVKGVSG